MRTRPDDPMVEDLAQETFERIRLNAHQFRGDSKVRTWILSIAKNVLREHARKTRKEAVDASPEAYEDTSGSSVPEGSSEDEIDQLIVKLLDSLPPAPRRALTRELSFSSPEEAREGLHGSEAAAHRQNVKRGRDTLMDLIVKDDRFAPLRRRWMTTS